ncbi:hypothetical protein [Mucilaginibacter flavus]|uniref:hypothetical protein n=1 Tax=Mucilaginibacter flavus TaxID=931504 RepID=UPI0025B36503|nr:hypothetical protein [Mucilaginibacter flavus]MDN3584735.1 hypothetical protein [Mucilaginibacter flavus]
MKLPNLISSVLKKTVDIDPTDLNELSNKSQLWYDENVKEYQRKEREGVEPELKDKVFKHLDSWYVRIILAFSFFIIVRKIQDFMNPGDNELDPNDMPG